MKKEILSISALLLITLCAFCQQKQDTSRKGTITITLNQANDMYYFVDHADEMKHKQIEEMKNFLNQMFAIAFAEPEKKDSIPALQKPKKL